MIYTETSARIVSDLYTATFTLYAATHSYHVNVAGREFHDLHELFGEQYEALFQSLDTIAERLRAMGFYGPSDLPAVSVLPGGTKATDMLNDLIARQASVIDLLHAGIDSLTDVKDPASADLLTERLAEHEKMLWMLKASLA